jgi:hypothetical protein
LEVDAIKFKRNLSNLFFACLFVLPSPGSVGGSCCSTCHEEVSAYPFDTPLLGAAKTIVISGPLPG